MDNLIHSVFVLSLVIVIVGVPFLSIAGVMAIASRMRKHALHTHSMRDWRDNARGRRERSQ